MKRNAILLTILALVLFFGSCSEAKPKIQTKLPKAKKTRVAEFHLNNENTIDLGKDGIVTASNGHSFIVINNLMPNMNVLHDTDCKKCSK